jgi:hypothetical protein
MTLPIDVNTVTVTGTYLTDDGAPADGSLIFTPSVATLRDPAYDTIIKLRQQRIDLDVTGSFSVALIATDDPDFSPVGWHYDVTERIEGHPQRVWILQLPYTLVTLDIADIASSVSPSLPVYPAPVFAVASVVGQIGDVTGAEILADATVAAALAAKASDADLDALTAVVATKAADADLDALTAVVTTKAADADLDALAGVVATKADTSALAALVPYTGATGDVDLGANSLYADNGPFTEGMVTDPTITDAAGVAISVTSADVLIRSSELWGGDERLYRRTVPANTALAVTDNALNYIYVTWNAGSPIYAATTDRSLLTHSLNIPVGRLEMSSGSIEYSITYGFLSKGSAVRNIDRLMRINNDGGIQRESGLGISETATRVVNIGSGYAWFGLTRLPLDAIVMGAVGVIAQLKYHSGGVWASSTITQYNNSQYDNGTNLVSLGVGRYAVNWVYRNIITNEMDIVLGNGNYTLAQAEASQRPPRPETIDAFYVLCGRIIAQNGATASTVIENVSSTAFTQAAVSIHNDLSGIQGGTTGEYYHLTNAQHSTLGTATSIAAGTPASSGAAGTAGQILYDTDAIYVCIATNTWKYIPLTSF